MRIDKVAIIEAECLLEDVQFWQEELVRPHDVYPDRFDRMEGGQQTDDGFRFTTRFLELTSSDGVTGVAGPITAEVAHAILNGWSEILKGTKLFTPRRIWDEGYRRMPHGRLGQGMLVLSAVELAAWDLLGRARGLPVVEMVGGPTRASAPAYASMLGFTVTDLDAAAELAQEYKAKGFVGQKWFFRFGPSDGYDGLTRNLRLASALREAVGEGYPLMFDAWQSLDVNYAVRLSDALQEVNPLWLEEPLLPDQREGMRRLRRRTSIAIAGGEHLYTRWGFLPHLRKGLYATIQPDLYWAGGFSETMRIAALAQSFDMQVIAHAHSANATTHFTFAQSPAVAPMQEHLIRWNMVHQYLLAQPAAPKDGWFEAPNRPGFGMELDLDRALSWRRVED